MMTTDGKALKNACVAWIRDWFAPFGPTSTAVLGMSGGKDSTVAAALCAEALGPERVIGVAMPADGQSLNEADEICKYLGIRYYCLPIGRIEAAADELGTILSPEGFSVQTVQNIPPRIRMMMLYAAAQSNNGFVANTCNLSEDYIGYATLFGDAAGSFSPLGKLVVREVLAIGHALGLRPDGLTRSLTTACLTPAPTRQSSASPTPPSTATSAKASAKTLKSRQKSTGCTPATCSRPKSSTFLPSSRNFRPVQ